MSEIVHTYSSINEFIATLSFLDEPLYITKGHVMFYIVRFYVSGFQKFTGEPWQVSGSGHACRTFIS